MGGLSWTFAEPFYTGPGVNDSVPFRLPVAIGGRSYLLDLTKYSRKTVPMLRAASDQGAEPGEQSLSTAGLWWRNQTDWRGGAGQGFFDDADSDRSRFLRSKGVDPWTRRQLSLLPTTTQKVANASTDSKLLVVGPWFYWHVGGVLRVTSDPSASPPVWTDVATGGAATSLTTDGSFVYTARSGALLQRSPVGVGTIANFTISLQPTFALYANGRLIGAAANRIAEIDAAGKISTDAGAAANLLNHTHLNPNFVWTCGVSAPNGIYVGGSVNGVSEIYYIGLSSTIAGALASPVVAATLPYGETIKVMAQYGNAILIGTDKGFRVAAIGANNSITFGPLVVIAGGVEALSPEGQYVWFGWSNYDSGATGLGRMDLARFTTPLVPAYASDLMAAATQGTITGVASFGSKRYFTVSASGLYGQSADLVAEGELVSGWVNFSTFERKVATSADVRHAPLNGEVAITVDYDAEVADGGTSVSAGSSLTAGSYGPSTPLDIGRQLGERVQVHVILRRHATTATLGPTLQRWTLRSIPVPIRVDEIIAPLVVHSRVLGGIDGSGVEIAVDALAEFQYLKSLESVGGATTYQEGESTYTVHLDGVELLPHKWTDDREFFEGIIAVRMLTVSPLG